MDWFSQNVQCYPGANRGGREPKRKNSKIVFFGICSPTTTTNRTEKEMQLLFPSGIAFFFFFFFDCAAACRPVKVVFITNSNHRVCVVRTTSYSMLFFMSKKQRTLVSRETKRGSTFELSKGSLSGVVVVVEVLVLHGEERLAS